MSEDPELAAIREEHRALLGALDEIRRLLAAEQRLEAPDVWAHRLRDELRRMTTRLDHHFQREEDGFYRIIQEERPTRTRELEALRHEHVLFMHDLQSVVERSDRTAPPRLSDEVRQELSGWLRRLKDHERRETELLVDAVVHDLGTRD